MRARVHRVLDRYGAACVGAVDGFTCNCAACYSGTCCAADIDKCAGNSQCPGGATCWAR